MRKTLMVFWISAGLILSPVRVISDFAFSPSMVLNSVEDAINFELFRWTKIIEQFWNSDSEFPPIRVTHQYHLDNNTAYVIFLISREGWDYFNEQGKTTFLRRFWDTTYAVVVSYLPGCKLVILVKESRSGKELGRATIDDLRVE